MIAAAPRRRVRPMPRSESVIQGEIVDFLRAVLTPDHIVYANANAARRTESGRASNAIPGLLPGIPDVSVACPRSIILYFEVKTPTGTLSEPQEHVIGKLRAAGCYVAVVTSVAEVEAALKAWMIPTRIARAA